MRVLGALAITLSVAVLACRSEPPLETVSWRGHTFQEVRRLADLPVAIQSRLGVGRAGLEGIADRGRPFNVTDVVDASLPMRRLLAAGRDGETWVVAVEIGGIGYSVEVYLYSSVEPALKRRWALPASPGTLRETLELLP
jgi:hypothetical protein